MGTRSDKMSACGTASLVLGGGIITTSLRREHALNTCQESVKIVKECQGAGGAPHMTGGAAMGTGWCLGAHMSFCCMQCRLALGNPPSRWRPWHLEQCSAHI